MDSFTLWSATDNPRWAELYERQIYESKNISIGKWQGDYIFRSYWSGEEKDEEYEKYFSFTFEVKHPGDELKLYKYDGSSYTLQLVNMGEDGDGLPTLLYKCSEYAVSLKIFTSKFVDFFFLEQGEERPKNIYSGYMAKIQNEN